LAAVAAEPVLAMFVVDPQLWQPAGPVRRAYLLDSLADLRDQLDGRLLVRVGNPVEVLPEVAGSVGAAAVHLSADFGPYGSQRDRAVEQVLRDRGVALQRTGSPYAVSPGRVTKPDGSAYRVFTPFARAWTAHGWRR